MSYISNAEFGYYRGYKSTQTISFAIPNEQFGSGLSIVVGSNNSGKTTLLEILLLQPSRRISDHERVLGNEPFLIYTKGDGSLTKITTVQSNSAQLKQEGTDIGVEIVPSRRAWASRDGNRGTALNIINQSFVADIRSGNGISVAGILKDVENNDTKRNLFTDKLRQIFPNFTKWFVSFDGDNDYIGYETKDGQKHRTDFLGDGVASIFRILAHLLEGQKDRMLIIDEPELSLQPDAQKRLFKLLAEEAKSRQIIISTHSTYFINLRAFRNGATFIRINKYLDKESTIHQLDKFTTYKPLFNGENWEMPFIFSEVAKEIFFQDHILFTEGQQDVGLIRSYFEGKDTEPSFNLFGYGVRGYQNFAFALLLAKDLGLQKVCVLIDSGEKETEVFTRLKAKYAKKPKYKIIQHSKEDIRDKPGCGGCADPDCKICKSLKTSKEGYFDLKGHLKAAEKDAFETLMQEIETYFTS